MSKNKNLKQGHIEVDPELRPLTTKQRLFCEYYLQSDNATQSAIDAGYSKKTAGAIGHENLKKPNVAKYIADRIASLEDELVMKSNEVLKRLTAIGRREEFESVVVTKTKKKDKWVKVGNTHKKVTEQEDVTEVVEIPARLNDVNKSLELLGKHHKLFVDRVEQDLDAELTITVDYGDED